MNQTESQPPPDHEGGPGPATPPIPRVLILEDAAWEADLIRHELDAEPPCFTTQLCADEPGFRQALAEFSPDVILADFKLPGFSGEAALALARQTRPETPFIFVSGVLSPDQVALLLRGGATDFVSKSQLTRLGAVVARALREKQQRDDGRRAVEVLRETVEVLRGTRRSFKSKVLGDLRKKLERLVETVRRP